MVLLKKCYICGEKWRWMSNFGGINKPGMYAVLLKFTRLPLF